MKKTAILVLSDPASGSDEALGRVFNALATAWDFQQRGEEVTVLFHGAGTRWVGHLTDPTHPAHALFEAVSDRVAGASAGCAEVFGAVDEAVANGFDLIRDNPVPGTPGLPSLARLASEGYSVLTF
jgi:hypothetical protein